MLLCGEESSNEPDPFSGTHRINEVNGMPATLEHFLRSAADIASHGDNDMLPFDVDTRFIKDNQRALADIAYGFYHELSEDSVANNKTKLKSLTVFNERLLAPAGVAGFRTATKIHPFWNLYFNGLCIVIAEELSPLREDKAWSYRYLPEGNEELFDRNSSWRAFREATAAIASSARDQSPETVIIQTDISSYYEHISHHYLENQLSDLFGGDGRIGKQIIELLKKFSGDRSFGLPVGGQGARVLAELMLNSVDKELTVRGVVWNRYVDDYVLIANSSEEAYGYLSILSHALGDYGLNLSRTKTSMLSAKNYSDYVAAQLGGDEDEASKLREIDVYFDPYSDTAVEEYDSLRETVESLQVQKLLNRELDKSLPDTFLVTQIGRTLRLQEPNMAADLIRTLLGRGNLHAFRGSWSSIMRGVASVRSSDEFEDIFLRIDSALDRVLVHSSHLLKAEANLLHFLRVLRFLRTNSRAVFVRNVFEQSRSEAIRRACIDCWRSWRDRPSFTMLRNRWNQLSPESQRMVWLASYSMGDEGDGLRRAFQGNTDNSWALGIERQNVIRFSTLYRTWCEDGQGAV